MDVADKKYNMEKIYIDLKKLFVIRKNYLQEPMEAIQKKIADLKNPPQKDTSFHIADFSYKLYANASALSDRIMSIADNYENIMEARNKEYCTFKNETIEK